MKARARMTFLGAVLLAALTLTPLRSELESGMSLHMLVQFPALMLAGALFATALSRSLRRRLGEWNAMGIAGLVTFAFVLAVLMIPRVLDLALVDLRVEGLKVMALMLAGAVLMPSWRAAGLVVQGFFLGNVLPMTFVVGTLYLDSPLRLCNAYRLDDQQQLGSVLAWGAGAVAAVWLGWAMWRMSAGLSAPDAGSGRVGAARKRGDG